MGQPSHGQLTAWYFGCSSFLEVKKTTAANIMLSTNVNAQAGKCPPIMWKPTENENDFITNKMSQLCQSTHIIDMPKTDNLLISRPQDVFFIYDSHLIKVGAV